jgi:hypothetical protein
LQTLLRDKFELYGSRPRPRAVRFGLGYTIMHIYHLHGLHQCLSLLDKNNKQLNAEKAIATNAHACQFPREVR